jgi:lysophospholipase L1-like esterase
MTRGRWVAVAAVVVLALAGVVVAVAVPAGRTSAARGATDCAGVTAQVHSAAATTVEGPGTRAAVVGDSYTSGFLLPDPRQSWAHVLARSLGWHARVDGFPGSGFTTDAGCPGERYVERVDRIPADAALVLVEGGLNDRPAAAQVPSAATELLQRIHARVPRAAVVVVGPPLVPDRAPGAVRSVSADLARAAAAQGATYLDTTGWSLPYLSDGVHLTVDGHRQFAAQVAAGLLAAHLAGAPAGG